jgi:chromate transporter
VRGNRQGDVVPIGDSIRAWAAVSLQTFGGPAGQIAVMHREFVERRRWIGERRFLHALSYCTLLPGPEAQQLAVYLGWLLNGAAGGLVAGTLFVLPGFVAILALSLVFWSFGDTDLVAALFAGVGPAVLAIVVAAVVRLVGRAFGRPPDRLLLGIAIAAFVALAAFAVPFPLVIVAAAATTWFAQRRRPGRFEPRTDQRVDPETPSPLVADDALHHAAPTWRRAALVVGVGAFAWITPVLLVAWWRGPDDVMIDQARFFGGTALITFGGAYAVLTFVAQRAVEVYGWLTPAEMVKGLAMAETTPGPLIMVLQFVGFLGAARDPGSLDPWLAGVVASVLVVWVTFVPSFVFVFVGAPHVERVRSNRSFTAALSGITAAVVGVIANLALFFSVHTLFGDVGVREPGPLTVQWPVWSSWRPEAFAVAALAFVLVFRLRWSVLRVIGVCGVVGGLLHLVIRT